jgi:hypothetical protein
MNLDSIISVVFEILKMPKGPPEAVNLRRTNNTMPERKRTTNDL